MAVLTDKNWKQWVDEASQPGNFPLVDLGSNNVERGKRGDNYCIDVYRRRFKSKVLALMDPEGDYSVGDLFILRRQIVLIHFLYGTRVDSYLRILDVVLGVLNKTADLVRLTDNEARWREAVAEAMTWSVYSPHVHRKDDLAVSFPREAALARASKWLIDKGYSLEARNGRINIESAELIRIVQQLDDDIRRLGGHRLVRHLLDPLLGGQHARKAHRYLGKLPLPDPTNELEPLVPVGYLINLAVKHLNEPLIAIGRGDGKALVDDILERAKIVAATFNAQPYSKIEEVIWPRHGFMERMVDYALFDRLFVLPDCRPSDVPRILSGLFGWVDDMKLGWTAEESARFAEGCLSLVGDNIGPYLISRSKIQQTIRGVRDETVIRLLDIFSHDQSEVNRGFMLPDKPPDKNDFIFRPLIKIGKQDYCLIHGPWCAQSFYEALAQDLRNKISMADERIGAALEIFVRHVMEMKGIACIHGKYCAGDLRGDCDAVVETPDTILLFEVKKKALRRSSRSGDQLKIMVDMAKGLIYGVFELSKQAAVLKERGELILKKDGKTFRIESRGRSVERIYVSLDNYGGLQDRVFTRKFLEFIFLTSLKAPEEYESEVKTINEYSNKLRQVQHRLYKADPAQYLQPFSDCSFLSLPHLIFLLDDVSSNESLREVLWTNRHFSFGTRDPYCEYAYAETINHNGKNKGLKTLQSGRE